MKKLRIGMISPWKVRCGIYTYTENLVQGLVHAKGYNVEVYIIRLPRLGALTEDILMNLYDNIPLNKIDLIHVQHEYGRYQNLEGGFYGALAKTGKPILTTMHATGNFSVDAVIASVSEKVIIHNQFMQRHFAYPHKTIIIPHGCISAKCLPPGEARKVYGIPSNAKIVGYCGYISPTKGLELLIDAMTQVKKVGLLVAGGWFTEGDTVYINDLKKKSSDILPGRCNWIGYVPDEELPAAYGAMDIVVYPPRYASESGALAMALSHGKAVIAAPLPPFKEKEDQRVLITFKDAYDLAKKIKYLLKNDQARKKLEKAAIHYVKRNSWNNIALKHIKLYEQLVKKK